MSTSTIALILLTLSLLALGQVLFKKASVGLSFAKPQSFVTWDLFFALCVYGVATLLWLLVLGRTSLSRAYPFYGLTFILVPLLASICLGETVLPRVWLGSLVIIGGILVATWGPE